MGVQMNTGKLWKFGTGVEIIGVVLLALIVVPTVFAWVSAEIEDAAMEEMESYEQQQLIENLSRTVEQLKLEVSR